MQPSLNMQLAFALAITLVDCLVAQCAADQLFAPRLPYRRAVAGASGIVDGPDLVSRCTENWHNTTLDHFNWARSCQYLCLACTILMADHVVKLNALHPGAAQRR